MEEQVKMPGTRMAMKYTPEGEVPVVIEGGVERDLPIPTEDLKPLPTKWRPKHHEGFVKLCWLVGQIVNKKRAVPATRDELLDMGIDKGTINDLESFGFVRNRIISLRRGTSGGKSVGARAVVYPTPQGHAYLRKLKEDAAKEVSRDN